MANGQVIELTGEDLAAYRRAVRWLAHATQRCSAQELRRALGPYLGDSLLTFRRCVRQALHSGSRLEIEARTVICMLSVTRHFCRLFRLDPRHEVWSDQRHLVRMVSRVAPAASVK